MIATQKEQKILTSDDTLGVTLDYFNQDKLPSFLNTNEKPEDWIKSKIFQNNLMENGIILRSRYLNRLGFDPKTILTKEEMNKIKTMEADKINILQGIDYDSQLKLEKSYSTPANDFALNYLIKSDDDLRKDYFNRLGILRQPPAPAKKHQSSILL